MVSDDLSLWTIERTFNKWGKTIRTEAEATEFPTILLEGPQGCANLLTSMLEADLKSLFLRERYYRTSIAAQTIDTTASNKSVVDKGKQKVTTDSTYCRFHIAYLLNAKLKDGTRMSPCKRGKDCRSTHASLNSITKSTTILLAGKLNPTLKETVLERIEEMSNKFKKQVTCCSDSRIGPQEYDLQKRRGNLEHKQRNFETYNRQYKSTITPTNILPYHASYNPEVRNEVISKQDAITTRITTGRTQKTTEVDDNAQDCNKYLSDTIATGIPTVRITQNSELRNDDTSKSIQRSTYSTLQDIATGRTLKTAEVNDNANDHKTKPSIVFASNIPTDHIATGRTRKTTEVNDSASDRRTLQSVSFATDIPTDRTPHSSETLNNAALHTAMAASTSKQIITKKIMNENLLNSIVATCNKYYQPMNKPTVDSIRRILTEAYISADENYGIEEAIEWANGFEIPSSAVASDMRKFRAAGLDFKIMVK